MIPFILNLRKCSLTYSDSRLVVAWPEAGEGSYRGMRKFGGLLDMFILTVMMVSQMHAYIKTHQILCFKHVQSIMLQSYFNKNNKKYFFNVSNIKVTLLLKILPVYNKN